jgi:hypothetical protein
VLETSRQQYTSLLERHKRSQAEKWEYLEVSTENRQRWGSLNDLGKMGWELIGMATYTMHGDLTSHIHTQYVFKRRLPAELPESFETLRKEIHATEAELAVQQRILERMKWQ